MSAVEISLFIIVRLFYRLVKNEKLNNLGKILPSVRGIDIIQ